MIGFLIGFAIFLFLISLWWYGTIPRNLPPGPLGIPILGSVLRTWRASTLPQRLFDWTHRYGTLYKFYVGNKLTVVLGDRDLIDEALVRQGDAFSGRPVFNTMFPEEYADIGITNSSGDLWKIQRGFAQSLLHGFVKDKKMMEPRIKEEVEHLLEQIKIHGNKAFDPALLVNNATSNVISSFIFGHQFQYDDKEFHRLLEIIHMRLTGTVVSFLTPMVLSKWVARIVSLLPPTYYIHATNAKIINFIRTQIKRTLQEFPPDQHESPKNFIQAYYKVQHERQDGSTFTDKQLIASIANLFIGGTENIGTMINWSIFCMSHHPEIQKRIYEEIHKETRGGSLPNFEDRDKMPFTMATLAEITRVANLLPLSLFHRTMRPTKLRGYEIPSDTVVVPLLTASLWDPKTYPNPERFDPNRFLNKDKENSPEFKHLIPFSLGDRRCAGEPLAEMELFLFFTSLMARFRFFFPPDYQKPAFDGIGSFIRAPIPYKICAEPRMI